MLFLVTLQEPHIHQQHFQQIFTKHPLHMRLQLHLWTALGFSLSSPLSSCCNRMPWAVPALPAHRGSPPSFALLCLLGLLLPCPFCCCLRPGTLGPMTSVYFNHLQSSLPSVPCLPRGRNQGGAGQWARKTPSAFGAGDLLSNCPDKGRTSQPEGVVAAEDTSGGSLACGLGPPAFPFSPQQPGCAPPFLLSQEKTLPSAYPGPVRPQSLASNYLLPGANLVLGLLSAPASGVAHVLSIQ